MLSDIIDISQIDAGELDFEKDDVEISSVCKDIACVMSFRLPAGVELSVENDLPECHIVTDRKRLHQVITNLVANAIKFTLRGKNLKNRMSWSDFNRYIECIADN